MPSQDNSDHNIITILWQCLYNNYAETNLDVVFCFMPYYTLTIIVSM